MARTIDCDNAQRLLIEICDTQRHQTKQKVADTLTKIKDTWHDDLMNAIGTPTLSTQPKNLSGAITESILSHITFGLNDVRKHYSIDSIMGVRR